MGDQQTEVCDPRLLRLRNRHGPSRRSRLESHSETDDFAIWVLAS